MCCERRSVYILLIAMGMGVAWPQYSVALSKVDLPVGCHALFRAATKGSAKGIKQALAQGADPNCHTSPAGTTALMVAVTNGPLEAVEPLLIKNADANAQDSAGSTALMFAAILGHDDVVQALLKKGADARIKNRNGQTALDLVKDSNDISVQTRGKDLPQLRRSRKAKVVEILTKQESKR
jgi:ankyrin repeat protein